MILVLPYEGIRHDSSIRRRGAARVVSSQHSSSNIIGEIPEVREQNVGNLLAVGCPHFSVTEQVEEGVECNSLDIFLFFFSTKPGKPKASQNVLIGMVSNLS